MAYRELIVTIRSTNAARKGLEGAAKEYARLVRQIQSSSTVKLVQNAPHKMDWLGWLKTAVHLEPEVLDLKHPHHHHQPRKPLQIRLVVLVDTIAYPQSPTWSDLPRLRADVQEACAVLAQKEPTMPPLLLIDVLLLAVVRDAPQRNSQVLHYPNGRICCASFLAQEFGAQMGMHLSKLVHGWTGLAFMDERDSAMQPQLLFPAPPCLRQRQDSMSETEFALCLQQLHGSDAGEVLGVRVSANQTVPDRVVSVLSKHCVAAVGKLHPSVQEQLQQRKECLLTRLDGSAGSFLLQAHPENGKGVVIEPLLTLFVLDWPPAPPKLSISYDTTLTLRHNIIRTFFAKACSNPFQVAPDFAQRAQEHVRDVHQEPTTVFGPVPEHTLHRMQSKLMVEIRDMLTPVRTLAAEMEVVYQFLETLLPPAAAGASSSAASSSVPPEKTNLPAAASPSLPVKTAPRRTGGKYATPTTTAGPRRYQPYLVLPRPSTLTPDPTLTQPSPHLSFVPKNSLWTWLTDATGRRSGRPVVKERPVWSGRLPGFRDAEWRSPFGNDLKSWEMVQQDLASSNARGSQSHKRKGVPGGGKGVGVAFGSGLDMVEF